MKTVKINGKKIPVREYHNERVLTFNDMHEIFGDIYTLKALRLKHHYYKDKFEEGDVYKITIEEFIQLYGEEGNFRNKKFSINLFTKSGFKKMFKSDRVSAAAIEIYEEVMEKYFGAEKKAEQLKMDLDGMSKDKKENGVDCAYAEMEKSYAGLCKDLNEKMDVVISRLDKVEEQLNKLTFKEKEREETAPDYLPSKMKLYNLKEVAIQMNLYTTNKLPHQELVKALIRVIGFTGEGDCASENFVILSSCYAKPKIFLTERGLQKLKNWFEKNRDSMFYIKKSARRYSKRNPAGIKRIGYQVGKKVFEISPDSEC